MSTDDAVKALLAASPGQLDSYVSAMQSMLVVHAVTTKHSDLIKHTLSGNIQQIESLLHPDFVAVDSSGNKTTRDQELATVKSGKLKIESNEITNLQVHPFGPNLAIVTGVAHTKGTFEGKSISGTYHFHQLWATNPAGGGITKAATASSMAMVASFNGAFTAA